MNFKLYALLITIFLVPACSSSSKERLLSATPTVYASGLDSPFDLMDPGEKTTLVELLYVTDRAKDSKGFYTHERSHAMSVGSCLVGIGDRYATWDDLERDSLSSERSREYPMSVLRVDEYFTFPDSVDVRSTFGHIRVFHDLLTERLKTRNDKEVYIFVHGYNNSFEAAAYRLSEVWHFIGRKGLPIIYTWPAGHPSRIRGYNYDTESAEFTIFHLKQFLRAVFSHPRIEKVHIIAHSHGSHVIMEALREIYLQNRNELKIDNLVLAAPDIDFSVFEERVLAEKLDKAPKRFTIYVSQKDRMIGLAEWYRGSEHRVGRLKAEDAEGTEFNIDFISCPSRADLKGHSYFANNPDVFSDLVLLLKGDRPPGKANGRPLVDLGNGFWEIPEGYPKAR